MTAEAGETKSAQSRRQTDRKLLSYRDLEHYYHYLKSRVIASQKKEGRTKPEGLLRLREPRGLDYFKVVKCICLSSPPFPSRASRGSTATV